MAIVDSRNTWQFVTQESNMNKGPLVKIEVRPGQFVKMYEADAIAQGLLAAKTKPASRDKARPATSDKARRPDEQPAETAIPQPEDDLTTIPGVGAATARALAARGITTFEALRAAASLDFLTPHVAEAIEAWRIGEPGGSDESGDV
jgi:predicted flap endonuclease-1-like 5' DNA nuclease